MKEGEGISPKNILCVTHGHRQQCSNGQREVEDWVEEQRGKMRPSVIESRIKTFFKGKSLPMNLCVHIFAFNKSSLAVLISNT